MNIRLRLGPPFFSIAMVFFGVQYLRYGHYAGGLPPVPPWAPGGAVGAYIAGVILIVGGLSILLGKKPRCGATMIGIFFLLCVVILHGPRLHGILYSGTDRTRAFEPLALSFPRLSSAFNISCTPSSSPPSSPRGFQLTCSGSTSPESG